MESRVLLALDVPQLPIPGKTGQVFMIEDFENKVTRTDLGFDLFAGNVGTINEPPPNPGLGRGAITSSAVATDSPTPGGHSLRIGFDFNQVQVGGQPAGEFGGQFMSLFGLTDTKVSLDGSGDEPAQTTRFPGYFLDFDDLYRGFGSFADRSLEQVTFAVRLAQGQPAFSLKVELKDEDGFDAFARVAVDHEGWATVTLARAQFDESVAGTGDPGAFDWTRVDTLSLIAERKLFDTATGQQTGTNPVAGGFLIDNVAVVDTDGTYPDWRWARRFPTIAWDARCGTPSCGKGIRS